MLTQAEKSARYYERHRTRINAARRIESKLPYKREQNRQHQKQWQERHRDQALESKRLDSLKRTARQNGYDTLESYETFRAERRAQVEARKREQRKRAQARAQRPRLTAAERERIKYWRNPNKGRARVKRWKKKNPAKRSAQDVRRRTRFATVPTTLSEKQWRLIKVLYGFKCAYCGRKRPLTIDHIVPIARGGGHTADNVIPACRSCNSSKRDRAPGCFQPLLLIDGGLFEEQLTLPGMA
jgi:5-methylcytosine-specific restriction endonuclease McrA